MNFKPTLWKTIVSLLAGVAGFVVGGLINMVWFLNSPRSSADFSLLKPIVLVVAIILVYVIWSIFQNNNVVNSNAVNNNVVNKGEVVVQ
tara:strand:- start:500 stop:766 length:267 start_codon:yes stop_codon:yes gene_type:complete